MKRGIYFLLLCCCSLNAKSEVSSSDAKGEAQSHLNVKETGVVATGEKIESSTLQASSEEKIFDFFGGVILSLINFKFLEFIALLYL